MERVSHQTIADHFDCTLRQIQYRDRAIKRYLKQHFVALDEWYRLNDRQTTASSAIKLQQQACLTKINDLLACASIRCPYCNSDNTIPIGRRAGLRCKHCRKTFNRLSGTPLNKMPYTNKWAILLRYWLNTKR